MASFDAVLFDFDGVLLDTEPIHCLCWAQVVQPLGIQLDWDLYRKYCIGLHDGKLAEFLAGLAKPALPVGEVLKHYPRKKQLFLQRLLTQPPFPPEVVDLLQSLRALKLAVVTSSERAEVQPVLEAGHIRSSFQALVCADDVTAYKPAPEPYLAAAKLLNARRPLVVEDSDAGVASGLAAGFEVLRVSNVEETASLVRARLFGRA